MATYPPGKLNYVWQYLSSTLDKFKSKLLGYKSYKVFLSQNGTDEPEAIVLENTLGIGGSYVYFNPGEYSFVLNGAYFASATETINGENVEVTITPSSSTDIVGGDTVLFSAQPVFFNVVAIQSYNLTSSALEDDLIGAFCSVVLEIKVYNK